jgi:predicted transposase YbfD/YdcC
LPKKTLKTIDKKGNVAIIQVKDNQKNLNKACQQISNSYKPTDQYEKTNTGHGRTERRKVTVFTRSSYLKRYLHSFWQSFVSAVIRVDRIRIDKLGNTKSTDSSYYVTTIIVKAKEAYAYARNHWSIENKLNYVRDESMGEDKSRIRKNPQNMCVLRSIALNVMRVNGEKNIKGTLYENCLNVNRIIRYKHFIC